MRRLLRHLSVLFAVLGMTALATPALGYTPTGGVRAIGPSTAAAGQPFTFTVTGFPPGTRITFSASGPVASTSAACPVSLNPTSAVTDSTGSASTTVTLPPGCCNAQFVISGRAPDGTSASLTVTETGCPGFPNTSTSAATEKGIPVWAMALAGFLLVATVLAATTALMRSRQRVG